MATDACEGGYGVVSGEFAPSLVSSWGRRLERHRFRFQSAVQGRKHALSELDPFSAVETLEDLNPAQWEGRSVALGSFDEISSLDLAKYHLDGSSRGAVFFYQEAIHLLRPVLRSVVPFVVRNGIV